MRISLNKTIENLTNLSMVFIAILMGYIIIPMIIPHRNENLVPTGLKLNVPEYDFRLYKDNVLFVLSDDCSYCTESSENIKRLVMKLKGKGNSNAVAIFPEDIAEGKKYLEKMEIPIECVLKASLSSIGVRATPTVILVDDQAVVKKSWMGKIDLDKEQQIAKELR